MNNAIFVLAQRQRMHPRYGWVGLSTADKKAIDRVATAQPGYTSKESCMGDDTLNPMFFYVDEQHARAAATVVETALRNVRVEIQ